MQLAPQLLELRRPEQIQPPPEYLNGMNCCLQLRRTDRTLSSTAFLLGDVLAVAGQLLQPFDGQDSLFLSLLLFAHD